MAHLLLEESSVAVRHFSAQSVILYILTQGSTSNVYLNVQNAGKEGGKEINLNLWINCALQDKRLVTAIRR